MATKKYVPPRPPVGLIVQWFDRGAKNARPCAATVCDVSETGNLSVWINARDGRGGFTKHQVWYKHDPTVRGKDPMAMGAVGCWDYVPGMPKPDMNRPDTIRKGSFDNPCLADDILALHDAGKSASDIADIMRDEYDDESINQQKVAILIRHASDRQEKDSKQQEKAKA